MPRVSKTPDDNSFKHEGVKVTLRPRGARWRADFYVPVADGKPMRHAKSYASKEEARAQAIAIINNAKEGLDVRTAHELTVDGLGRLYLQEWHVQFKHSAPNTLLNVAGAFKQLSPIIGGITLENLRRSDVIRARDTFMKRKLNPGTIQGYIGNLRGALKWAMDEDRDPAIISTNVAAGVKLPSSQREEKLYIPSEQTTAETLDLLASLKNSKDPLLLEVTMDFVSSTGSRIGECLKLELEDFNRDRLTVKLNSKTKNGHRTISIDAELLSSIDRLAGRWGRDGKVFVKTDGKVVSADTVRRHLRAIAAQLEVPRLNPHIFRHYQASRLLADGFKLQVVKDRLGHKDIATTSNLYGQLEADDGAEQIAAMNARWKAKRMDTGAAVDEVEKLLGHANISATSDLYDNLRNRGEKEE